MFTILASLCQFINKLSSPNSFQPHISYQNIIGKNLTVKTLTEPDFIKHLELAIQFGNPFLFENVDEELDPLLDPVLEKSFVKEGNGLVVKLGTRVLSGDIVFVLL